MHLHCAPEEMRFCRAPRERQKEISLPIIATDAAIDDGPLEASAHAPNCPAIVCRWLRELWGSWRAFWNQRTRAAAIALALLYLTVLSLGLLMTAYVKAQGLTEAELAVDRGFGAVTGVLATFSFPPMRRKLGKSCNHFADTDG